MKNERGEWVKGQEQIMQIMVDYYSKIYTLDGYHNLQQCLQDVPKKITNDVNRKLCEPVIDVEIKKVVDSLGRLKALGPYGLNSWFYHRHWEEICLDICRAIRNSFTEGHLPEKVNET